MTSEREQEIIEENLKLREILSFTSEWLSEDVEMTVTIYKPKKILKRKPVKSQPDTSNQDYLKYFNREDEDPKTDIIPDDEAGEGGLFLYSKRIRKNKN